MMTPVVGTLLIQSAAVVIQQTNETDRSVGSIMDMDDHDITSMDKFRTQTTRCYITSQIIHPSGQ